MAVVRYRMLCLVLEAERLSKNILKKIFVTERLESLFRFDAPIVETDFPKHAMSFPDFSL